jgi:hypothetical protein
LVELFAFARSTKRLLVSPNLLGDMPVVVRTRGLDASPDQQAAHAAIAELSRNSRHIAVPGSDHEIHLSRGRFRNLPDTRI